MTLRNNPSFPDLPMDEDFAKTLGEHIANELAIRSLIEKLDRENGKRGFQQDIYDAKKCPQKFLTQELGRIYKARWANEATNSDSPSYLTLRESFVRRISSIQDTYRSLRP